MTAYVIDNDNFSVYSKRKEHWDFNMSEEFGPEWRRFKLFKNEDELYEYWHDAVENTGEFYEGLGVSEDMKHEMFKEWLSQ